MITHKSIVQINKNFSAGYIIDLFNSSRREILANKFLQLYDIHDFKKLEDLRDDLTTNLCNPVLIPTVIAGSILGIKSHLQFLNSFLAGGSLNEFEDLMSKVDLSIFNTPEEATQFTILEKKFYRGLYLFLLESFVPGGKNTTAHCFHLRTIERLIHSAYSKDGIRTFKTELGFSPYDLRWTAWQIFNMPMAFLVGRGSRSEAGIFFNYGFSNNSRWHNQTEKCEYDLNLIKKEFNRVAKLGEKKGIEIMTVRLEAGNYFWHRSKRLYWWNPCEIDAHKTGEQTRETLIKFLETSESGNNLGDEKEEKNEK